MKDRAREFGENGAHKLLARLQIAAPRAHFHLMGHSFGCIVASATVAGPVGAPDLPRPVDSLFLVQGALSLWAYAGDIPYAAGTAGYFHRIVKNGLVRGPIVTTRSTHDTAVGRLYPLGAQVKKQLVLGNDLPAYGGIGSFGIQGAKGIEDMPMRAANFSLRLQARGDLQPRGERDHRQGRRRVGRAQRHRPPRGRPRVLVGGAVGAVAAGGNARAGDSATDRRRPSRRAAACSAARPDRAPPAPRQMASPQSQNQQEQPPPARPQRSLSRGQRSAPPPMAPSAAGPPGKSAPTAAAQRWVNVELEDQPRDQALAVRARGTRWPSTSTSPSVRRRSLADAVRRRFAVSPRRRRSRGHGAARQPRLRHPRRRPGRCACRASGSRATRRASRSRRCTTARRRSRRPCTRTATSCRASPSRSSSAAIERCRSNRRRAAGRRRRRASCSRATSACRSRSRAMATTASSGARSPRALACRCSRRSSPARSRRRGAS